MRVGLKNGAAARHLLEKLGMPIVSESLYGTGHRNIIFDIATGYVWARQVHLAAVAEPQSRAYT
jgi:chemotaxis protein CheD